MRNVRSFVVRNLVWFVAAAAVVVLAALVILPQGVADSASFFGRYQGLSQNTSSAKTSIHKELACSACHTDGRGSVVHALAVAGDFYVGLVKRQKMPLFVRFESPKREACLGCHREEWSMDSARTMKVPHPAHLRVATETRECVKCHKWTAHEEAYMQKHKQMPFSGVCVAYGCHVGTKSSKECGDCHHTLDPRDWKLDHPRVVQTAGANGCLDVCHKTTQCRECHTTGKTPSFSGPAVQAGLQEIQRLHVKSTWLQEHGTEALKDESQCLKCHVSTGECKACHAHRPAFHGSTDAWIGTHKKFAKDKRRCLACHEQSRCDACHRQFKEMR